VKRSHAHVPYSVTTAVVAGDATQAQRVGPPLVLIEEHRLTSANNASSDEDDLDRPWPKAPRLGRRSSGGQTIALAERLDSSGE